MSDPKVTTARDSHAVPGRKIVPWLVAVMVILATTAVSLLILNLRRTASAKPISIAVRPFVDESAAHDQDYFCDGVAEELSGRLGLFPALRVVSSNSVFRLRTADTAEFAKQLGLDAILEGGIRKDDGRLRIHLRLSRVAESAPVWEHTFDEAVGTEVTIEDQIVREVINRLKAGFVRPIRSTQHAEAHDLYLRGRELLRRGEASRKAIRYFQQATVKDSQYARAFAGLAEAYDSDPGARAAAIQALSLDESLGEAHATLAHVLMLHDADWVTAEKELNRAKTLSPQYPEAWLLSALLRICRGSTKEALMEIQRAIDLDPVSPRLYVVHATVLLFARDYASAIATARRAIELEAPYVSAHDTLGRALVMNGDYAEGIAELKTSPVSGALGWGFAMAGDAASARDVLRQLMEQSPPPANELARVYAGLGDRDHAFQWLDRVIEHRGNLAESSGRSGTICGRIRATARY